MAPLRIYKHTNEWCWDCRWCGATDSTNGTHAAAIHLAEAHYLLRHWPMNPTTVFTTVAGGVPC